MQRVSSAKVTVDDSVVGAISAGALVLVGISPEDAHTQAVWLADKVANLRIYGDAEGKMDRSLLDVGGEVLLVSQFTLYGDARKGRRPSFIRAAGGPEAAKIYDACTEAFRSLGITTSTGQFGALMAVESVNDGPITILLDSDRTF